MQFTILKSRNNIQLSPLPYSRFGDYTEYCNYKPSQKISDRPKFPFAPNFTIQHFQRRNSKSQTSVKGIFHIPLLFTFKGLGGSVGYAFASKHWQCLSFIALTDFVAAATAGGLSPYRVRKNSLGLLWLHINKCNHHNFKVFFFFLLFVFVLF